MPGKLHKFTVTAGSAVVGGVTRRKGDSFTLPVGSPNVAAHKANPRLAHTLISAPAPRGRVGKSIAKVRGDSKVPPGVGAAYTGLCNRLIASVEDVERMTPDQRAAFDQILQENRPTLAKFLVAIGLVIVAEPAEEEAEEPAAEPAAEPVKPEPPKEPKPERPRPVKPTPPAEEPMVTPAKPPEPPAPKAAEPDSSSAPKAKPPAPADKGRKPSAEEIARAGEIQRQADQAAATEALKEVLLHPEGEKLEEIREAARLAGLQLPPELEKGRDRKALVSGIAALLAAREAKPPEPPAPKAEGNKPPDPSDLG